LTLSEVKGIKGEEGNFEVSITQYPRYVDMEKCIACGLCAEKCPKKVVSEYDEGLTKRKAAYVQYAQAVPLKYALDPENCIYLQKGKCRACEKFCPADAIKFDDVRKDLTVQVGAIIFAGGCEVYDPKTHDVYGYGKSPNIVTSLEFERILSSSGPYGGHLVRPSDKKEPEKIAWLQCIGSRDTHIGSRNYCSSVCCTYAIKEAMLAKEHSKGSLDTAIFYMDIRTHGKDFERYYNRGRDEAGIRFVKSRITNIDRVPGTEKLLIRYINEVGERVQEEFDMVVLSVGLGVKAQTRDLAKSLGIGLNQYDFASTNTFEPVKTSVPGIMICGAFEAPKDIPSSVMESSAAAGLAASRLYSARFTRTREKEVPQEVNVRGEPPRVGVFVCRCGTNIASVVDVPSVVEFAKGLPGVVYTEENMFSCSQDTQEKMAQIIKEHRLNRIVVAACTPKTHEPLFQETVTNAGINKYLFEMANIRNQCSWVHSSDKDEATEKAKDLVRMAVAKVVLLEPLVEPSVEMNRSTLVVGGGISGMAAARLLSSQGYHVYLVEKEARLGGQALDLLETWRGEDIQEKLKGMIREVESDENIEIRLGAGIKQVDGFVGNFKTTITRGNKGEEEVLEHGVAIIASGASELKPHELPYLYGKDSRVVTSLELDRRLIENTIDINGNQCVAFLQCVGSRIEERPYCSKVCCTHSVKSALKLKELNPDMDVFIIYRDMRTYGLREDLYREARERGVVFLRYDFDRGLNVDQENGALRVRFTDTTIRREMELKPDLFVLATAIVPLRENPLAKMFKIPVNEDGFFMEAHVKLRPVDCATDGVFICGLAHAPKPIDEAIAQAQAAATRAVSVLAKERIQVSGNVAQVDPTGCSSCGVCIDVCPYSAPSFIKEGHFAGKSEINPVLCKGCGLCVASCRSGAIKLAGFDTDQIMAMIEEI